MHSRCGEFIDIILNSCVEAKTLDNITAVVIGFPSCERLLDPSKNLHHDEPTEVQFDWEQLEKESEAQKLMQLFH